MSPQSSSNIAGEVVQKQKTNVYTVMLIISFFAIVTACVLLYIELTRYGSYPWWKPEAVPAPAGAAHIHGTVLPGQNQLA